MNLRKFKTVVGLVKKEFLGLFSFEIARNNVYSKGDYLDAFLYLTQRHSAYCGSAQMKYLDEHCPDSDSLLYTLKKCDVEAYRSMVVEITDKLLDMCFRLGIFRRQYVFDVAIDYHDRPYYGDRNDDGVVGSMKKPHWAFRYATIDIIERGCTFTLFVLPFVDGDTDRVIVDKLVREAKKRVKINCLYADAEFASAELIDVYEKHNIEYIIRAKGNYVYKVEAQQSKTTSFVYERKRYYNKRAIYTSTIWVINVFEKHGEIKKESYYTNIKPTRRTIEKYHLQYDKRWNIETDYRTNNNFMPRTCAKAHVVRAFYFFLADIMRNVLTFINLKTKKDQGLWYREKSSLSSFNLVFLITQTLFTDR